MGFRCGIVGLPNVGKSTLFNALTDAAEAAAENYPFCTIEPNVGQVPVPDERLQTIAAIGKSAQIIPTLLSFVDIAGLVRGASKGEGLGNQFLANIRETDAILHVLRCFEDGNVTHVEGKVDPIADAETVETELMLADLESLEKRLEGNKRKIRGGDKDAILLQGIMERAQALLAAGKPARLLQVTEDEATPFQRLQLLSQKPVLFVANVPEDCAAGGNDLSKQVEELAAAKGAGVVVISAAIEAEVSQLEDLEERQMFLSDLGLAETGLARLIRAGYDLLGLITFFTVGPKEARAWTITDGDRAPQAAGTIHTDFERGFIKAETIAYDDFSTLGGEQAAKDAGKMRQEGKE
jgi:GTP-binding protein YchF